MVCNLMLCNIFMCLGMITYSTIKYTDAVEPKFRFGCMTLIGYMIFTGFGPIWGIILTVLCRALSYSNSAYWNRIMTTFRFFELRIAHSLIDMAVVYFLLDEIGWKNASSVQCTYQFMIHDSNVFFYYGITLIIFLISAAIVCIRNRTTLRRKMSKSIFFANTKAVNQRHVPPVPLCLKPFLLITFEILIFLFTLPRIALLMTARHKFYTVASACPLLTAFVLPFVFLLADQDMRFAMFSVFTCRISDRKRNNIVVNTKSELALTNKGFTDF